MTPLTAFIVEDSPIVRENLIAALEELAPVKVLATADDESSATAWLGSHRHACDLVVIDAFLREGSGLGVLASASAWGSAMNLVVLTNYATADMRDRCLRLGASRVFDKSNELEALITYCAEVAEVARAGRPQLGR